MQKLTFQTLTHCGALYSADGEEADIRKGTELYLASEADAEIAKLKEALRFYADAKDFYVWDRDGKYHDNGNEIARIALGPIETVLGGDMSFSTYDLDETLKGVGIERTDIKRVVAAHGVTEAGCCDDCGGEWSGGFLMELKSGKFVYLTGWCDYTGWGCQDGTGRLDFDSEPALESLDKEPKGGWETTLPDLQKYIETGDGSAL